jgi:hypothetical protein
LMARLAPGKKCNKIAPVCPKLGLVSEVWEKYGIYYKKREGGYSFGTNEKTPDLKSTISKMY